MDYSCSRAARFLSILPNEKEFIIHETWPNRKTALMNKNHFETTLHHVFYSSDIPPFTFDFKTYKLSIFPIWTWSMSFIFRWRNSEKRNVHEPLLGGINYFY